MIRVEVFLVGLPLLNTVHVQCSIAAQAVLYTPDQRSASLRVKMAAPTRPSKLYALRNHREELLKVIEPHLDQVAEACFSRIIISAQAYTHLMNCDNTNKPNQLFVAIGNSVTRTENNYEAFLRSCAFYRTQCR